MTFFSIINPSILRESLRATPIRTASKAAHQETRAFANLVSDRPGIRSRPPPWEYDSGFGTHCHHRSQLAGRLADGTAVAQDARSGRGHVHSLWISDFRQRDRDFFRCLCLRSRGFQLSSVVTRSGLRKQVHALGCALRCRTCTMVAAPSTGISRLTTGTMPSRVTTRPVAKTFPALARRAASTSW